MKTVIKNILKVADSYVTWRVMAVLFALLSVIDAIRGNDILAGIGLVISFQALILSYITEGKVSHE